MSNRLYQTVLHQMKDVVGRTIGIIDENGIVIACSELSKIGESKQRIKEELAYSNDAVVYEGYTYRFINVNDKSCEGISYEDLNAFTVQFDPESCGIGHPENIVYDKFFAMMEKERENA